MTPEPSHTMKPTRIANQSDGATVLLTRQLATVTSTPAASLGHNAFEVGTKLGEFEILGLVGEGGFGIVYLAYDHSLERKVALKEYMPSSLAQRVGRTTVVGRARSAIARPSRPGCKSFINEARLLAQFDHPSLVKVYRFWEANGTAYMVMPFYEGIDAEATRCGDSAAPPDEAWLLGLLAPLIEALDVHPRRAVLSPRHRARQRPPARRQRPAAAARLRRGAARHRRHDAGADGDPEARLRAGRAVRRSART